ncbi:hypothetical protein HS088_TW15G00903 [Tripterygium wilfordii]|uniref:FHA domain-containing protein n=1 Tax=Tripterygium wilfordii TaxID=458696 RepID=A0A7J7CMZ0_TRIWF|nr:FHA domain-containing protein PS1 isoform X2 [Tripterygium wilfordii]KAF5735401.1 hypothetical protein HS088_TW15G00903 [Tripterygium wilfordii]
MADKEEQMIPVLTVLKKGAILKNIFLVNKPPPPEISRSESVAYTGISENLGEETEEILIVGRHPDCNIVLTHPSISRFHLQIHSNPSSQKLSVVDLSSVHGTWISGMRIDPGVLVQLREGDTIRVGGSTRVYRLHWVPLYRAYDMENPFMSPLDMSLTGEKEEEEEEEEEEEDEEEEEKEGNTVVEGGNEFAMFHDEKSLLLPDKDVAGSNILIIEGTENVNYKGMSATCEDIQSLDMTLEGLELLFSLQDSESCVKKVIPSAPLLGESMNCDAFSAQEEGESPLQNDHQVRNIMSTGFGTSRTDLNTSSAPVEQFICESKNQEVNKDNQIPKYHPVAEVISAEESMDEPIIGTESRIDITNLDSSLSMKEAESHEAEETHEAIKEMGVLREDFALPVEQVPSEAKTEKSNKENQTPQSLSLSQPLLERGNQESSTGARKLNLLVGLSSSDAEENDCNLATEILEEAGNQSALSADLGGIKFESPSYVTLSTDPVNFAFSVGEAISEIVDDKESEAAQTPVAAGLSEVENRKCSAGSEKISSLRSMRLTRGKLASVEIQTYGKGKQIIDAGIDSEVELQNIDVEGKPIMEAQPFSLEGIIEEILTPEKENLTPDTLLLKSPNKKGNLESTSSSKVAISLNLQHEKYDMITFSDKENETPKLQHQKSAKRTSKIQEKKNTVMKRRVERVPLQPLTAGNSRLESLVSIIAGSSSESVKGIQKVEKKNPAGGGKRRWTMVADTTSLLEKGARKSLQLLQGLKGTQLIIPRMVIRELDCLKRCSIFRRTEASSVLEWIEECMFKTKWWIHVQSSVEEGWPVAPTPPASPQPHFSEGGGGFSCGTTSSVPFSIHGSLMNIVSPTAEDHILDHALHIRKMKNDGQEVVLLSNDITLKIKAMAEGLICETAQEFRDSLVNPFSERFLWSGSSPRGHTWSVLDDVVLKERYCRYPFKKSSKGEGAKGLKLILLHNSHYGQMS